MSDQITIKGAREHNLKNVNLVIPKNKLVVLSGVSGSGKSSLAMDTLYAEGQRRYVESLSAYARQFLGMMRRPNVDTIDGLSPAIAIDQHGLSHNPRSTVGTVTEIYDYLRLLFARIGHPHCPNCGREISKQTSVSIREQIFNRIREQIAQGESARYLILSPVVRDKRGEFGKLLENLQRKGFDQIRLDGRIINLTEDIFIIKTNRHNIEVVIDRINQSPSTKPSEELKKRLLDDIELGLSLSNGLVILSEVKDKGFSLPVKPTSMQDAIFSQKFACPICNISLPEIEPRLFSFNSPQGACPKCEGIGIILRINPDLVLNKNLTILEGGIVPWFRRFENESWTRYSLEQASGRYGFSLRIPIGQLPDKIIQLLLYGDAPKINAQGFEGVAANLERRYRETDSDYIKQEIERFMVKETCPSCQGSRLKKESLSVTIHKQSIAQASALALSKLLEWTQSLLPQLQSNLEKQIGQPLVKEINNRLNFLVSVGVDYLSLDRMAATLSVGEAQRIRLASQIGTGLTGVLYVLDEPTVGLHQRDTKRLIQTLQRLRDLGNTVVVVEHDQEVLNAADWIVDFGPLAGKNGGQVVAEGTPSEIKKNNQSLTGKYLSGRKVVASSAASKSVTTNNYLTISGCREHNLKDLTASFPLNQLICLTGVSGSGKSTLMHDTLYPAIKQKLDPYSRLKPGRFGQLEGYQVINQVLLVDQSPIGRTSRSNPATYTGVFTDIRELFALTPEARVRGYSPGYFSFNIDGGRCEVCRGQGVIRVEMQFLPDVWVECEECGGTRFKSEILEVEFKDKNIAQALKLTIAEALEFFRAFPKIVKKLRVLQKIGLDYLELGQASPTLSGGESQRLKLARELVRSGRDHTLYLLDEPTTGLHYADVEKLLVVMRELVNQNNTMIVIEHNLDIVKNADYLIDLGPEGGDKGGKIVAEGTPIQLAKKQQSWTGQYLKKSLG
jgi:excinuclease ABC subunit A